MKKLLPFALLFISAASVAQDYLGFVNSNYAGITGAQINPANIADSRMRFDMTLFGLNVNAANNYVGIKRSAFAHEGSYFDVIKQLRSGGTSPFPAFADSAFQTNYLTNVRNGREKSIFLSTRVTLPSFMISLGTRNAIGISVAGRMYANVDGVSEQLAELMYSDVGRNTSYQVTDLLGKNLKNKRFSMNTMAWMEYGLTYAHVFKSDNEHFWKAGITPKFLMGYASAYTNVNNFEFRFDNNPLSIKNDSLQVLAVVKTEVNYAHSANFDQPSQDASGFIQNQFYPGFGMDMGLVYEWRPKYMDYKYDMDGKQGLWRRDKNKYKLKAGLSLLDLGSIKFPNGEYSGDFSVDIDTIRYRLLETDNYPVYDIGKIIDSLSQSRKTTGDYRMSLPTSISMQIDYNIWKDFYINLTPYIALQRKNKLAKVHDVTVISLAPRWDHKWFGLSVPVSYNTFYTANQPVKVGAMLRLGPLIVGTNDIASYTAESIFGANLYFMLKVPVPYGRVKDKDKDNVSNKRDRCKDVPGTWEFKGCPDRDGDHIQDIDDKCPDVAGPKELNGCPDRDLDGITDAEDACPDEKGLAEFKGCADSDNDKVIDKDDECPFVAGLIEFMGCPDTDADGTADKNDACPETFGPKEYKGCPDRDADSIVDNEDSCPEQFGPKENKGCPWPDTDKDGILDKDDDCPAVAGVPELKGCPKPTAPADPVAQTVPMKAAEKKIIEKAFATLEFATAKDVIKPKSLPALNDLAKLLIQHEADWKLKLAGHTDNEGKAEKNMLLSEKRAKSVKNYLVKKGVKEDQIIAEWYGQTMPIADNKTPKGKQKNRRVEMKIMLKE